MNIALLCKKSEVTASIATYLHNRGHYVFRTDEKVTARDLRDFEIGISFNYRHILKQDQIDAVNLGIINFHTGYLPEFRGANPNIWQVLHGRGGVTAHFIDAGIDTGPIVAQSRITPDWIDTGETYYKKLNIGLEKLFYDIWPAIEACGKNGIRIPSREQERQFSDPEAPDYHTYKMKDVETLDDLTHVIILVRKLAARTFPPYKGCYINTDKGKVYIRVSLEYGE